MKNNSLSLVKKLVLTAALSALTIILGTTPLGMIPLGAASLTILHIPVIIAACLVGLWSGVFVGSTFGILSLILAATRPTGALDPLFVNPLVSVLPRILFAVVAWGLWKLLNLGDKIDTKTTGGITVVGVGFTWILTTNILPINISVGITLVVGGLIWILCINLKKIPSYVLVGIAAFVSTLIHTLMVIGCLYIFQGGAVKDAMGGTGYWALIGVLTPQASMEAVAAIIITVAVYFGIFVSTKRKSKISNIED